VLCKRAFTPVKPVHKKLHRRARLIWGILRFFARLLTGHWSYRQQGAREENAKMIVVMELIKNPLIIGLAIMAVIWVVVIYGSEYLNKNVQ
jgi:hypothetical protein